LPLDQTQIGLLRTFVEAARRGKTVRPSFSYVEQPPGGTPRFGHAGLRTQPELSMADLEALEEEGLLTHNTIIAGAGSVELNDLAFTTYDALFNHEPQAQVATAMRPVQLGVELESLLHPASGMTVTDEPTVQLSVSSVSRTERLNAGDRILHYRILEHLGEGGMGDVYLVRDETLQRDVAAKFLRGDLLGNAEAISRFQREATAAARIAHENVVRIYSIEPNRGDPFITAEYIKGTDLTTVIKNGPVPLETAGAILTAISRGLAAAHAASVIHRDLKPANIRIRPDGTPVIVDFGLGKVFSAEATDTTQPQVTGADQMVGTVQYMSPDQIRQDSVGPPSDVFSFGVVAFELLTMSRPFDRATPMATIAAILNDPTPDIQASRADVPGHWREVIERALNKRAVARPSADDVSRVFAQLTAEVMSHFVAPTSSQTPIGRRAVPPTATLLAGTFPNSAWFEDHATLAHDAAKNIGTVMFELSMSLVLNDKLVPVQQLYQIARSIPRQSASYQGTVHEDDRWRVKRGADDIYAVINFENTKKFWYWAVRRNGDAFLSALLDDSSRPRGLSIELLIREFLAALIHCREFVSRFVGDETDPELLLRARVRGASDRTLFGTDSYRAFPNHLEMYGYKTDQNDIEATVRTSLSSLRGRTNLRGAVETLFGDLVSYFNFLTIPGDYLDYAVEVMDK